MSRLEENKTSVLATVQGGGGNITQIRTNTKGRYPNNIYVVGIKKIESWIVHKLKDNDNTNVESRSLSVVKYVINNVMSAALTVRIKTATYLHLVRELLYNIDWPSGRLLTYWHFVHV